MLLSYLWVALRLAHGPVQVVAPGPTPVPPRLYPADSVIAEAREALERGRPWQASRLITPVLADSTHRMSAAVFLAATAASRWGGWPEVSQLLTGQSWLDSLYEGRGRLLLA